MTTPPSGSQFLSWAQISSDLIGTRKMSRKSNVSLIAFVAALSASMVFAEPVRVFIPEGSADAIRIVDGVSGAVLARVTGTEAVHGLAGAPTSPYLVAGSYAETDVENIEAARPQAVSVDEHAAHHAKPTKKLGPNNAGISLLSVIEASSGEIIRRVEVPGAVHHTAVSPDGRFAVATHPSEDGISVVDLSSFEVVAWVTTGPMPNYAVFGNDPTLVYVSNAGNGTISEVNLTRGIVRRNLVAGEAPEHLVMDPGGNRLFAADADAGEIIELSLSDGAETRRFEIGGEVHGLDLSEDGGRLFVAAKETDQLAAVDLISGEVTFVALAPAPYHLTTIPGTGNLFVSSRDVAKIWIVDAETLSATSEVPIEGEGHQMVVLR